MNISYSTDPLHLQSSGCEGATTALRYTNTIKDKPKIWANYHSTRDV